VVKVAGVAQQHAGTFVESDFENLQKVAVDEVFDHDDFEKYKQQLTDLEKWFSPENPPFALICGKMLGIVKQLGNVTLFEEQKEEDKEKRVKMTTGRFKRKLERLKVGFANGDGDNVINFTNCSGPGIMICCELAQIPKSKPIQTEDVANENEAKSNNKTDQIDQKPTPTQSTKDSEANPQIRDISEWREEVECDIRRSVILIGESAFIWIGEIKSSSTQYATAVLSRFVSALHSLSTSFSLPLRRKGIMKRK